MDNDENDAPIPGVDNSQLETACLELALLEALAIVQAARRGTFSCKGKARQSFGRQRVPNSARDQRQNDDRPAQVVGRTQRPRPQPQQRRGTHLQAKLDKRKARSVCHACGQTGHWARDPQCPSRPVNVIELEDEVQEFERIKTQERDKFCQCRLMFLMCVFSVLPRVLCIAMNSMDVGRREEPAVSSTLQPGTELLEEPGTVRIVKSVLKEVLDTSSM